MFLTNAFLHWIKENAGQLHAADLTRGGFPFQGYSYARGRQGQSVISFSGAEAKMLFRRE